MNFSGNGKCYSPQRPLYRVILGKFWTVRGQDYFFNTSGYILFYKFWLSSSINVCLKNLLESDFEQMLPPPPPPPPPPTRLVSTIYLSTN